MHLLVNVATLVTSPEPSTEVLYFRNSNVYFMLIERLLHRIAKKDLKTNATSGDDVLTIALLHNDHCTVYLIRQ